MYISGRPLKPVLQLLNVVTAITDVVIAINHATAIMCLAMATTHTTIVMNMCRKYGCSNNNHIYNDDNHTYSNSNGECIHATIAIACICSSSLAVACSKPADITIMHHLYNYMIFHDFNCISTSWFDY